MALPSSLPFRGPAADSRLGELLIDVLAVACGVGFALDLSQHAALCGTTWRRGDRGATNDMIASSLRLQAPWLAAARRAPRGEHKDVERTTMLMRAADEGCEQRVRELVAAGAPLDLDCERGAALQWAAAAGHERVVAALLDGKFEAGGSAGVPAECRVRVAGNCSAAPAAPARATGASIDLADHDGRTALMRACIFGHEGVVRTLLARGARQELQSIERGQTALHFAVSFDQSRIVELLCAAPGADAALAHKNRAGRTPLAYALWSGGRAGMVAALRARGAPAG
jgi:ankyrin repeat protein